MTKNSCFIIPLAVVLCLVSCTDGFEEKNADLVTLDLPEPWNTVRAAIKALKVGGFLVNYSPSITSTSDFVSEIMKHKELLVIKTVELVERLWTVDERRVHPKSVPIGHSGFLTFVRRIL